MEIAGIILGLVLIAIVASAAGSILGPLLFALGFLAAGVLFILDGGQTLWVTAGVLLLLAGVVELGAAMAYWDARALPGGPPGAWRATAVTVGLTGSVGFVGLLVLVAIAMAGFYSQL